MGKVNIGFIAVALLLLFVVIVRAQSSFTYTSPPPGQPAFARAGVANPPAVVISGAGAIGGSTTYNYTVVAYGHSATGALTPTLLGGMSTTITGQATLSSGIPIVLVTQADPGAVQYDFLKMVGGVWKSICLAQPATTWQASGVGCSDIGQTPAAYVLPQTNATTDLIASYINAAAGQIFGFVQYVFTGLIQLTGGSSGPNFIKQVSINGVVNVTDPLYGAVSSTLQPTCTATGGSPNVACTGTGDFFVGQHVTLNHGGATVTISAPSATVTPSNWAATPNATVTDSAGATSATYLVGSTDGLGGIQMAASAVTTSTSESALTFYNFNKIAWSAVTGSAGTVICGCVGTSCTLKLIGIVPANQVFYYDMGSGTVGTQFGISPDSVCVAGAAFNDNDNDTIATFFNGVPTSLTHNVTNNVTSQPLFHDNSVAINAADNAVCSSGGTVYAPAGLYTLGQQVLWSNCKGVKFEGAGNSIGFGTALEWLGPLGGTAYKVFCIADSRFSDFTIDDASGATPSYGFQLSNVGCTLTNNTSDVLSNLFIGESGYGLYISDAVNNSPHSFYGLKFFNGGIADIAVNNGQSKNNGFFDTVEARRLFGFYQITSGNTAFYNHQGAGWIEEWLQQTSNITWFGGEDEVSARYVVTSGPTGATGSIAFYSSQLQQSPTNLPPDGIAFSDNFNTPLILNGVNFIGGGGLPQSAWCIQANISAHNGSPAVISQGVAYTTTTPFSCINSGNSVISMGDHGSNGSSFVTLPTLLGTQSYYNAASNAIPTCSALYAGVPYCVSDETTACTQSNTYASGGTNKCQVQCNAAGTLWKVTGTLCY